MSAPHSLSQSHSQRVAAQLPFSPSQSGNHLRHQTSSSSSPSRPNPPRASLSSIPPHVRSGSIVSSKSRHGNSTGSAVAESPHVSIPMYQPRPMSSGSAISPSSSFFYPSRPNNSTPPPPVPPLPTIPQTPPPARPLSAGSIISSEAHATTPVHLTSLTKHSAKASDVSDSIHASTEDFHYHSHLPSGSKVTTQKHSREPLLPIGAKSLHKPSAISRPSLTITAGPYGRSESSISPGGRMRDSFEKLFKRNSYRKNSPAGPSHNRSFTGSGSPYLNRSTQNSPISPATNGRMTFEVSDDEGPLSAVSRYKEDASPGAASSVSFTPMQFNPLAPDTKPSLSEIPILDPKTDHVVRKYRLYPSRNSFFLGGHVMTGGDSPLAFIASLLVVFGIAGVWFGTTCVWWWKNESPAVAAVGAYMCLLTISSMCATAFRDPGILPRNLDPEPPYAAPEGSLDSLRAPLPRDLKVRAGIVRVKYCPTCRTYRPPRSSHCKMCDNCVDNCDHHCQWVNNCVGRRNYTSFFTFLGSAVATLILVICTTAIHLYLLTRAPFNLTFKQGLQTTQGTGSAVAFCMSILVVWPVSALLAYHLRLLLLNVTTIEQIRNQAHKTLGGPPPPNPFSHGNWRRNLYYVMCRPGGFSWLDATGLATEDKREINPGMLVLEDEWRSPLEEGRGRGPGKGQ